MSNIAEGFERDGNAESRQFLSVAKGSAGEVRSLFYVLLDAEYINEEEFNNLTELVLEVSRLIGGFMSYLDRTELRGIKHK